MRLLGSFLPELGDTERDVGRVEVGVEPRCDVSTRRTVVDFLLDTLAGLRLGDEFGERVAEEGFFDTHKAGCLVVAFEGRVG